MASLILIISWCVLWAGFSWSVEPADSYGIHYPVREKASRKEKIKQWCRSEMFIPDPNFFHPGSDFFPSRIRIREFSTGILTQKIVSKLPEICSALFIPDPDPDFLPITDPRSQIQRSKRHRIPDLDPQHWNKGVHASTTFLEIWRPSRAWIRSNTFIP